MRWKTGLLIAGLLLFAALLGHFVYSQYEERYLSAGERRIAEVSLDDLDSLRNCIEGDRLGYELRLINAERDVNAAKRAASTNRDSRLSQGLEMYLSEIGNQKGRVAIVKSDDKLREQGIPAVSEALNNKLLQTGDAALTSVRNIIQGELR